MMVQIIWHLAVRETLMNIAVWLDASKALLWWKGNSKTFQVNLKTMTKQETAVPVSIQRETSIAREERPYDKSQREEGFDCRI